MEQLVVRTHSHNMSYVCTAHLLPFPIIIIIIIKLIADMLLFVKLKY